MDVAEWLRGLGLESHVEAFSENAIDAEALVLLSAELERIRDQAGRASLTVAARALESALSDLG